MNIVRKYQLDTGSLRMNKKKIKEEEEVRTRKSIYSKNNKWKIIEIIIEKRAKIIPDIFCKFKISQAKKNKQNKNETEEDDENERKKNTAKIGRR